MKKYIISGGGTGGHIFPAVSIANALKQLEPDCEILFVGALGRMEMERVPQAGYKIVGLPIRGFDRKHLWKNISVLWDLQKSLRMARKILKDFKPDMAIGVGGYASGAALKAANRLGIPTLLQEQNSFAGVTNKLLAKDAEKICVAYKGMERFFPADKIVLTGNPVRQSLMNTPPKSEEAYQHFGFSPEKKTLLVVGGSLGARTLNQSMIQALERLQKEDIQIIWQTGKFYIEQSEQAAAQLPNKQMLVTAFVDRMDYAYSVADLVVSRAGASSISELCLLGKASVLVPSPNVSEDHQTHNAMALVNEQAAVLVRDADAKEELLAKALEILNDDVQLAQLAQNSLQLAQFDSDKRIAEIVMSC